MKHFNWQKLFKNVNSHTYRWDEDVNSPSAASAAPSLNTVQLQAWKELTLVCNPQELASLVRLAHKYETGERVAELSSPQLKFKLNESHLRYQNQNYEEGE